MTKSVMTHNFSDTPRADIPRSSFDRSHGYKTTFDSGYLIPFYCDEALPGDTFNLKLTAFARLATPIKPIMDNLFMETFFFSVPVRQVWSNWAKFNGEQTNPTDSTDYTVPIVNLKYDNAQDVTDAQGTICDYMGIPISNMKPGWNLKINALHLRAYNHIFNNWFRNQNLSNSTSVFLDDGPDDIISYRLRHRSKRPDYFTSCLPWPQKGEAVKVPIGGQAPITGLGTASNLFPNLDKKVYETGIGPGGNAAGTEVTYEYAAQTNGSAFYIQGSRDNGGMPLIYADLTEAEGVSINDLRQSFAIQKIFERDARGGTRYPEILKAHFGVTDPQMLVLQRPEFLGGGSSRININPVEQNSQTTTDGDPSPQGNLSAFGTVTLSGHGFTKSFTEHCLLIGIVNVRADLTYQQGLNRMWSRQTRFDYYWPALSHIGEQSVLNKEIFAQGDNGVPGSQSVDDEVFGYQERYSEYRYKPSLITGQFRSTYTASLDVWHLSQDFAELPTLNHDFISDNPPIDRIIAVPSEPQFLFDAYIALRCARPMPLYGTPGLIDHF